MSWPKGRQRPRKVGSEQTLEREQAAMEIIEMPGCTPAVLASTSEKVEPPIDWRKGALLNVRNHGAEYIITLWPEEYSPEREERCIKFTNLGECQGFVSDWYSRQSHDPRAR